MGAPEILACVPSTLNSKNLPWPGGSVHRSIIPYTKRLGSWSERIQEATYQCFSLSLPLPLNSIKHIRK